jgi:predicted metal-binding membrane protein
MNTSRPEVVSQAGFRIAAALLFLGSAAVTLAWCGSMASMPGMPWMVMPGQTWTGATTAFVGMWSLMMVAMMLPVLTPALLRFRQATGLRDGPRLRALTALGALGYYSVWTLSGLAMFPLGIALAALPLRLSSIILILAGVVQLSAWKSRQLTCCRQDMHTSLALPATPRTAWRHGVRLGLHCFYCCAPLTGVLLVLGVMEPRVMAAVTVAIALERLAPAGQRVASLIGIAVIAIGFLQLLGAL